MTHENLWAPWRMAYLRDLKRRAEEAGGDAASDDGAARNFLRVYWEHPERDDEQYVVERSDLGMILLNRYPYSNGHLLVALGDPRPSLLDYEPEARAAFWRLVDRAAELMHLTINPQGINIGVNQGDAAGAGVPEHLHAHLVPRWSGDTNFISTVAQVRVIPDALDAMFGDYRKTVQGLNPTQEI